jgi:hypothetical protein
MYAVKTPPIKTLTSSGYPGILLVHRDQKSPVRRKETEIARGEAVEADEPRRPVAERIGYLSARRRIMGGLTGAKCRGPRAGPPTCAD